MISRDFLEKKQINIYLITLLVSALVGCYWSNTTALEKTIEPIIAVLLYSMFCQIPFLKLKAAFANKAFFMALLFSNFVLIPVLVGILLQLFPLPSVLTLGVLLVLLTPCIDYVIVFTHLGRGDSRSVLAATPLLFAGQLLLLPLYLWLFLGKETVSIIAILPFVKAFVFLIVVPFVLSLCTQMSAATQHPVGEKIMQVSTWLPVPFMALTFFVVIASQIGSLVLHPTPIISVLPLYVGFAILAPLVGWISAQLFRLKSARARALVFSSSTRNSLVVLPLALALPAPENQLVAAVIVTQTIVELFFELLYIRWVPKLIKK